MVRAEFELGNRRRGGVEGGGHSAIGFSALLLWWGSKGHSLSVGQMYIQQV